MKQTVRACSRFARNSVTRMVWCDNPRTRTAAMRKSVGPKLGMPTMRYFVPSFVLLLLGPPAVAQSTLGGCPDGDSGAFYARVVEQVPVREYRSRTVFMTLRPGDEVRVCRSQGSTAVVTLLQSGVGFRVASRALQRLDTWTSRVLAQGVRNCVATNVDAIQSRYSVDEQTRHLVALARRDSLSMFQLLEIRMDPYPRGPCEREANVDSSTLPVPPTVQARFEVFYQSRLRLYFGSTANAAGPLISHRTLEVNGQSLLVTLSSDFFDGPSVSRLCDAVEETAVFVERLLRGLPRRPLNAYSVRVLYQGSQDIVLAHTNPDGSLTCRSP